MDTLLPKEDSHSSHDDLWCIVSESSALPLCIACLVERLEQQSLTKVQNHFNLSLLANTIKENEEALRVFREHPLVCQHVLDIVTDHYTSNSFMADSVQICVQLMDALQSEELYLYLLDKFQHQVLNNASTYTFVVGLLAKISAISSAYVSTLILSHERLLVRLLEMYTNAEADEASSCSLLFLLTRFSDQLDILPAVSPSVLPLVEQCMLRSLTSAQPEDVHINAVALLKCLLKADCCLRHDSDKWTELFLGLKRLFVSKKETLVIAATQCLGLIAGIPRHAHVLRLVLDTDLPEFMFEALHTISGAQLENLFVCLLLFSEQEQFFKKCHAVYGLESVIRSLDVMMETQNVAVLAKGYSLLSNMLQRQPSNIPMFVNVSTAELTMSVVTKGVHHHAVQVVLPAVTAATTLFQDVKVCRQQLSEDRRSTVKAALGQLIRVTKAAESSSGVAVVANLPVTAPHLLAALLSLLMAALTSWNGEQDVEKQILEVGRDNILPYFSDHFTECDNASLHILFKFLNMLYKTHDSEMQDITEKALISGLVLQVLMKKADFRCAVKVLTSASSVVENVFQGLLREDCAHCQGLPDYLRSGLRHLSLKSTIHQTVSDLWDKDAAAALCMVLYFCCLNRLDVVSPPQIGQVLGQLQEKGMLYCAPQRPLTTKFLLFLLACADSEEQDGFIKGSALQSAERTLVQLAMSEHSVDHWATPHPRVFTWVFAAPQRAQDLGASLLEHWLLHTKGSIPTAGEGDLRQSHAVCTLFLNSTQFRATLFNLMASSSEEICVLLRKLFVTLITSNVERGEEQSRQLIRSLYEEVMSKFQSLFMLSVQPKRHIVNSFLKITIAIMQHPMCQPSEPDQNKQIGIIYHLVHCIGGSDGEDSELLYNGLATLDCLSNITDEEQDQLVVPILLQNTSFMQQLEKSLHRDDQQLASVALSVVAWISSSSSSCQTEHPITVSTEFIIDIVTQSGSKQAVAALKILHLSLDLSSPLLPSPLTFRASHTYHHDGALYTAHEMRLLFTYVQQYICLENEEIQFYAIKCYLELLNQSKLLDNALGDQLLHHPWNPQLLHCVLTNTATAGLQLHTADFIHRIWCLEENGGQAELAKLVLESVLATEINPENQEKLQLLVQKARRDCQDDDLVEQATLKLEALENSLSFSQNTLVSTT